MFKISYLFVILLTIHIQDIANASANSPSISPEVKLEALGSINPKAAAIRGEIHYRYTYQKDISPLWNNLYIQSGVQYLVSPAFARGGVHIEWMPIAVFQLRLRYDYDYYFGNAGSLLNFNSPDAAYSDQVIEARKGSELTAHANRFSVNPILRAKFDNIIIRSSFEYYRYHISANYPYFLERSLDILVARNGQVFSNKLNMFYRLNTPLAKKTLVGPMYEYLHSKETKLTQQRLGLMWFQTLRKQSKHLKNTRWFTLLSYYIEDRHRENELYFGFGIGTNFDFN